MAIIDRQTLLSVAKSIRAQIPPIYPKGYPFVGGFALVSLLLFWLWAPLGWIGTLLTVWCAFFFRNPVRVTPIREGIVVAPADGRISMITQARRRPNSNSVTSHCCAFRSS